MNFGVRRKSREVDLSRLKGFHLRFAPKMRSGVTGNWSDDIWKLNGGKYRFHSDQNNRMCVRFSCSVIKWLQTNILNQNWWYRVAKTRPKLVSILNWSPERRYISSGVVKVHFWQQTSAVRSEWWSTSTTSALYNDFRSPKNVAIVVENRVRTSKYQFNCNCCFKALN